MDIDTDGMAQTVTRGKYMWDPEEEEFPLFLRSILNACKELLDEVDLRCGVDDVTDRVRASFQMKLFHSLAMQYVDPVSCLEKIARPEAVDPDDQKIYRFRAYIGKTESREMMDRVLSMQKGDKVLPATFRDWRLTVKNVQGNPLGYLSFADDRLYYCLFPLMQARMVQLSMTVVRVRVKSEGFWDTAEAEIRFLVRIKKEAAGYQNPDGNEEIRKILEKYQKKISRRRR